MHFAQNSTKFSITRTHINKVSMRTCLHVSGTQSKTDFQQAAVHTHSVNQTPLTPDSTAWLSKTKADRTHSLRGWRLQEQLVCHLESPAIPERSALSPPGTPGTRLVLKFPPILGMCPRVSEPAGTHFLPLLPACVRIPRLPCESESVSPDTLSSSRSPLSDNQMKRLLHLCVSSKLPSRPSVLFAEANQYTHWLLQ